MKERPIIFKGDMVRAILDGRKTQTRRIIKSKDVTKAGCRGIIWGTGPAFGPCPYGVPGDLLWVRETWAIIDNRELIPGGKIYVEYKADTGNPYPGDWPEDEAKGNPEAPKWKPSIHMPRWASRITLLIKDIRVERLQNITDKDVCAEGVIQDRGNGETWYPGKCQHIFARLWDSINEKKGYGWDTDPWVWVIEFERI